MAENKCPTCGGFGNVPNEEMDHDDEGTPYLAYGFVTCPTCGGAGESVPATPEELEHHLQSIAEEWADSDDEYRRGVSCRLREAKAIERTPGFVEVTRQEAHEFCGDEPRLWPVYSRMTGEMQLIIGPCGFDNMVKTIERVSGPVIFEKRVTVR